MNPIAKIGSLRLHESMPSPTEKPHKDVGDRLRLMMAARDLRSFQVCERLGISSGRWANYVVGSHMIPNELIRALLVYGVSADWLLYGDERNLTKDFADALSRVRLQRLPPETRPSRGPPRHGRG
jgi:transcriptional regulator with XRE-family HTH domain